MYKKIVLSFAVIFIVNVFSALAEERITIVAYYPAPYAVYNELRADRFIDRDDIPPLHVIDPAGETVLDEFLVAANPDLIQDEQGRLYLPDASPPGIEFITELQKIRYVDSDIPENWTPPGPAEFFGQRDNGLNAKTVECPDGYRIMGCFVQGLYVNLLYEFADADRVLQGISLIALDSANYACDATRYQYKFSYLDGNPAGSNICKNDGIQKHYQFGPGVETTFLYADLGFDTTVNCDPGWYKFLDAFFGDYDWENAPMGTIVNDRGLPYYLEASCLRAAEPDL